MAQREPKAWITVSGKHVPIYEGESKQDAYNRAVAKHNEETKERQIKESAQKQKEFNIEKQDKPPHIGHSEKEALKKWVKDIGGQNKYDTVMQFFGYTHAKTKSGMSMLELVAHTIANGDESMFKELIEDGYKNYDKLDTIKKRAIKILLDNAKK